MTRATAQNKDLVQRFIAAMNARRLDTFPEFLADDVRRHCEATPAVDVRSCEQFAAFMRQDGLTFPDSLQTLSQLVAEDDRVAAWGTYTGTQRGPMGTFQPSGKGVRFDFSAIFRIADGRIAEWWITWDNLTILGQLGHLPPSADKADR